MSDTPETLDDNREYPQPEHAQVISFEGRDVVILSPEGYEELFRKCQRFERERDNYRQLDSEAATYVESVICMRTDFSGQPPYVGWKGIGLKLAEILDERDALKAENAKLKAELAAAQMKIDWLMLEYCPDDMTPEQIANWEAHQRPLSAEDSAKVDAAARKT